MRLGKGKVLISSKIYKLLRAIVLMINLREKIKQEQAEELRHATGLEYWKLRFEFARLPQVPKYICRNIADFLDNKSSVRINEEVVIPRLIYFPHPERDAERFCLPISLRDKTGELEVYVRDTAYYQRARKLLVDALCEMKQGDMFIYGTIRCGMMFEGEGENCLYLTDFYSKKIGKPKRKRFDLAEMLEKILPEIELMPEAIGVRG